jgi:phosphatidate cytidylyltransferase
VTRVLSGAVLIAIAVGVVWFAPVTLFRAAAFGLLWLGARELVGLARASGLGLSMWLPSAAALVTCAAFTLPTAPAGGRAGALATVLMVQAVAVPVAAMARWTAGSRDALATVSAALLPSLYLGLPIGALVALREMEGPEALFLLMLTVMVSDTAQYYTGRLVGRTPLAPSISPKKTLEGAVGGFVFGALVFTVVGGWWLARVPFALRMALGLAVVAAGIAGDLFESMLKRSAGVKDSSSIIPGHGGILDRIDALLFAAPIYFVALQYA